MAEITRIQPRASLAPAAVRRGALDEHLVSLADPHAYEAEQYRTLRHLVEQEHQSRGVSVVAVSSADVGDGKTTTAINLAGALAQATDRRVLLVDADLRRPAVASRLGLEPGRRGLAEAVFDASLDLTAVSQRYASFNLSVVPAGRFIGITYEALQSSRFGQLVAEARQHYDHVILDTPPMLPIADARIIGPYVDRFILVVGAHRTPRKLLGEALSLLPPDKVLGLIFNYDGHSPDRHRAYYGLESPEPPPPARGWGALARAVTGLVGGPGSWR